jgi:hypothetical protein
MGSLHSRCLRHIYPILQCGLQVGQDRIGRNGDDVDSARVASSQVRAVGKGIPNSAAMRRAEDRGGELEIGVNEGD